MLLAGSRAIVVVLCLISMRKIVFIYNMKGKHRFFYIYVKAHSLLYVIITFIQLSSLEIEPSTWNLKNWPLKQLLPLVCS